MRDSRNQYVPSYYLALLYEALGDRDKAFTSLNKSFDEHSSAMVLLRSEPALDSLRSDGRFKNLLRRVADSPR